MSYADPNADTEAGRARRKYLDEHPEQTRPGDQSQEASRIAAENEVQVTDMTNTKYSSPGAAEYGGDGGVEYYKEQARLGGMRNDAAQRGNSAALSGAIGNMTVDRGPQAVENNALVAREMGNRDAQLSALNLSRDAAMGNAPSEAAFQTRIGMNDIMGQQSGNMGSARGLAGLSGAQMSGSAAAGSSAGNLAMAGGLGRSKEIGDAIRMYGSQAGAVRSQDLARLKQNTSNGMFNADSNEAWKLGNAGLAQARGKLGLQMGQEDLAWKGEEMKGASKQFEYDQRMAAVEAGAEADSVAASLARNREDKENKRQLVNGGISAGLGAMGSLAGPAGTAAGTAAGQAFGAATKDWWK